MFPSIGCNIDKYALLMVENDIGCIKENVIFDNWQDMLFLTFQHYDWSENLWIIPYHVQLVMRNYEEMEKLLAKVEQVEMKAFGQGWASRNEIRIQMNDECDVEDAIQRLNNTKFGR